MLWGLFKEVVIADRCVILVSSVFENYENYSGVAVIAGIAFYTLQLYCDFSGVMDVMCGLGSMFGIKMPENFARPFFAKTINEFWQKNGIKEVRGNRERDTEIRFRHLYRNGASISCFKKAGVPGAYFGKGFGILQG